MNVLPYAGVLCDIDGVLRHFDPLDAMEEAHGLAVGTIAAAAFAPGRLQPAITGAVTDEQWRSAVAADLAEVCGSLQRAEAVVAEWSAAPPRGDPQVARLLTRVRQIVPVVLVSNATTRLEHDLELQGLSGVADAVVNSCRIGVTKPDPQIYRSAAEQAGVPLRRCLFIDDAPANVDAASQLGMTAHLHRSPSQLQDVLAPLLV